MISFLPNVGGIVGLAGLYVDPALGFALGWNAWCNWTIILPTELSAAVVLINGFFSGVPQNLKAINLGSILILLVIAIAINTFGASVYGETEFIFSCIKILTIIFLILFGIALDAGAGATGRIGFSNWHSPGPFLEYRAKGGLGRFLGVWSSMNQAAFAFFGTKVPSVVTGEVENPTRNIPGAVHRVWIRITLFYVLAVFVAGLLVKSDDKRLMGGSSSSGNPGKDLVSLSPFVIALQDSKIKHLDKIINAAFVISAFSAATSDVYISSRHLFFLAHCGHAPRFCAETYNRANKTFIPWVGILVASLFALVAFMLASNAEEAFHWLSSMNTTMALLSWVGMLFTYLRWYQGTKYAESKDADFKKRNWEHLYRSRNIFQPFIAIYAFIMCILILVFNGWFVFTRPGPWRIARDPSDKPIGQDPDIGDWVPTFVSSYLPLPLFVLLALGYKLIHRTQMIRVEDMNLARGEVQEHRPTTKIPAKHMDFPGIEKHRPTTDEHGVTPEMLARSNQRIECTDLLQNWRPTSHDDEPVDPGTEAESSDYSQLQRKSPESMCRADKTGSSSSSSLPLSSQTTESAPYRTPSRDRMGSSLASQTSGFLNQTLPISDQTKRKLLPSPLQTRLVTADAALQHANAHAWAIESVMLQYGISVDQYIVRSGFNENLIVRGIGLLEQIYVLLCVDVAPTSTLLTMLGRILSPYPCTLITPAGCQQLPTFKANGDLWDLDSIIMSRTVHFPSGIMSRHVSNPPLSDMTYKYSTDTSSTPIQPGDGGNWDKDDDARDGESGESRNGDRPDHPHDSGEDGGGSGGGGPDPSKGKQPISRIPRAHFQATAEIYCRNSGPPFQDLMMSGKITTATGEAYPPEDEMSESKAKFLQLKFQTRSRGGVSTSNVYQQYFCHVTVDTNRKFANVLHATPSSTLDSEVRSKEMTVREAAWTGTASAAGKGILVIPSFEVTGSTSRSAKNQTSSEVVKYSSRIIQEDSRGTALWRFFIDDKNMRENGLRLDHDKLPSVEFEFFGDEGSTPPSTTFVEVASYWTIPVPKLSWSSFASCRAEPLFQNVCHIIAMELPTNMTKSVNYVVTLKKRSLAQDETCVEMNQGSLNVQSAALSFNGSKVVEEASVPSLILALKTEPAQKNTPILPSELPAHDTSAQEKDEMIPKSSIIVSSSIPAHGDVAQSVPRGVDMG